MPILRVKLSGTASDPVSIQCELNECLPVNDIRQALGISTDIGVKALFRGKYIKHDVILSDQKVKDGSLLLVSEDKTTSGTVQASPQAAVSSGDVIETLSELGYPERLCVVAYKMSKGNADAAAEWLLHHGAQYISDHPAYFTEKRSTGETGRESRVPAQEPSLSTERGSSGNGKGRVADESDTAMVMAEDYRSVDIPMTTDDDVRNVTGAVMESGADDDGIADRSVVMRADTISRVIAWGTGREGQLASSVRLAYRPIPIEQLCGIDLSRLCAGTWESGVIDALGDFVTWGTSHNTKDQPVLSRPHRLGELHSTRVLHVSLGATHHAVVCQDGAVLTWGRNSYGRLGHGRASSDNEPVVPTPQRVQALKDFTAVQAALGACHTLFLLDNGIVCSCGRNNGGQLGLPGDNFIDDVEVPTVVPGLPPIERIYAGPWVSVAVTFLGDVYLWGCLDRSETLGDAAYLTQPTKLWSLGPRAVVNVVVQGDTLFVHQASGAVVSVSLASLASTDTPRTIPPLQPVAELEHVRVVQFGVGYEFMAALTDQGHVLTKGSNEHGELGHSWASATTACAPVQTSHPVSRIAVGGAYVIAELKLDTLHDRIHRVSADDPGCLDVAVVDAGARDVPLAMTSVVLVRAMCDKLPVGLGDEPISLSNGEMSIQLVHEPCANTSATYLLLASNVRSSVLRVFTAWLHSPSDTATHIAREISKDNDIPITDLTAFAHLLISEARARPLLNACNRAKAMLESGWRDDLGTLRVPSEVRDYQQPLDEDTLFMTTSLITRAAPGVPEHRIAQQQQPVNPHEGVWGGELPQFDVNDDDPMMLDEDEGEEEEESDGSDEEDYADTNYAPNFGFGTPSEAWRRARGGGGRKRIDGATQRLGGGSGGAAGSSDAAPSPRTAARDAALARLHASPSTTATTATAPTTTTTTTAPASTPLIDPIAEQRRAMLLQAHATPQASIDNNTVTSSAEDNTLYLPCSPRWDRLAGLQRAVPDMQLVVTLPTGARVEIPCHRFIVMACPFIRNAARFHAPLGTTADTRSSDPMVIEIPRDLVTPDILRLLVEYLYSDSLELTFDNVFEVAAAADTLGITSARALCEEMLSVHIDESNALSVLPSAVRLSLHRVADRAIACLAASGRDVQGLGNALDSLYGGEERGRSILQAVNALKKANHLLV